MWSGCLKRCGTQSNSFAHTVTARIYIASGAIAMMSDIIAGIRRGGRIIFCMMIKKWIFVGIPKVCWCGLWYCCGYRRSLCIGFRVLGQCRGCLVRHSCVSWWGKRWMSKEWVGEMVADFFVGVKFWLFYFVKFINCVFSQYFSESNRLFYYWVVYLAGLDRVSWVSEVIAEVGENRVVDI